MTAPPGVTTSDPRLRDDGCLDFTRILKDPPPLLNYLVPGYIAAKEIVGLIAAPKTGKSMIALDLALRLARGWPIWGLEKTAEPLRVGYLDAENNEDSVARRVHQMASALNIEPEAANRIFYRTVRAYKLDTGECFERCKQFVEDTGIKVLIFDSYRRFMSGVENDSDSSAIMGDHLMMLRNTYGLAIIVVHHTPRSGGHARGSSDFEAWCDTGLYLERPERDGGKTTSVKLCMQYSRSGHDGEDLILEWRETRPDGARKDLLEFYAKKCDLVSASKADPEEAIISLFGEGEVLDVETVHKALKDKGLTVGINQVRERLKELASRGVLANADCGPGGKLNYCRGPEYQA